MIYKGHKVVIFLKMSIEELQEIYKNLKPQIISRLEEFKKLWLSRNEKDLFKELIFCILTPQSKAEVCWEAVNNLEKKGLLFKGNVNQLREEIKNVRFRYKKAEYILEARKKFIINGKPKIKEQIEKFKNIFETREWLVKNVKGIGYKEASHFLRNIGIGENLAILDRHILKNLKLFGVINKIPRSLSKKIYFEIEKKMKEFSEKINIPLSHLDFILWYKETRKIFK